MVQNLLEGEAPSMAAASIRDFGIDCRPARKKQEIVRDLPPGCGNDHQDHGLVSVQRVIPAVPQRFEHHDHDSHRGIEQKEPQNPCNDRCDGIGPDDEGFVDRGALDHPVGHHGKEESDGHGHPATEKLKMTVTWME